MKRGKPYLELYSTISKISVWIVDGSYIRKILDKDFTNFGQHYRFKFIPKNEFWIDKEYGSGGEEKFYIDHLLVEHRLMEKGLDYISALEKADKIEKRERAKSDLMKNKIKDNNQKEDCLDLIHKKLLKKYSDKHLHVWLINGEVVRDVFYIDFTEGGHDKVFSFIPPGEVWIEEDLNPRERGFVLLHELHERNLMKNCKGVAIKRGIVELNENYTKDYNSAHQSALKIEYYCRHHPAQLQKAISKEIKLASSN